MAARSPPIVAWLAIILTFFILAIQLFATIAEFKLTLLAGFGLVLFALWNRTSFLAEQAFANIAVFLTANAGNILSRVNRQVAERVPDTSEG